MTPKEFAQERLAELTSGDVVRVTAALDYGQWGLMPDVYRALADDYDAITTATDPLTLSDAAAYSLSELRFLMRPSVRGMKIPHNVSVATGPAIAIRVITMISNWAF